MSYIGRSLGQGVRNRFIYTATAGQTTFSGSDDNGITLVYTDGTYVDVNLNGVELVSGTDYTDTSGTSIVLTTGASLNDTLSITVYDVFAVADTVSAQNGGTFSGDVNVTGDFQVKGGDISFYEDTGTPPKLFWDASAESLGIGTSSPTHPLEVTKDASGLTDIAILSNDNTGVGNSAGLLFAPSNGITGARIEAVAIEDFSTVAERTADLLFYTRNNGTLAERMRIDASGNVLVGQTTTTSSVTNGGVYIAGDRSVGSNNYYAQVFVQHNSSQNHGIVVKELGSSGPQMGFLNSSGTLVGSITSAASSTSYNTSSDYRLKENVTPLDNASDRLKQIPVHRFNFIADPDTTVDGFLAHEVQAIIPEAVTGTKDAMRDEEYEVTPAVLDDDGNVVTEAVMGTRSVPDYQGIDQSKLVPLLTAALQEALTKIEDLEARVTALETP